MDWNIKERRSEYRGDSITVAEYGIKNHKRNEFITTLLVTDINAKFKSQEQKTNETFGENA
jgi:hypothetical protein